MTGRTEKLRAKDRELTPDELDRVAGGLTFTFKLVAVKTVGWAHDDETPPPSN